MKKNTQRPARILLAVGLILVLGACQRPASEATPAAGTPAATGPAARGEATAAAVYAVNVTPAVQGQISDYIELNGDVRATATVEAFADVPGELVRLLVSVGQTVTAGQIIAEVDPSRPGQTFVLSQVKAPIAGTVTQLPIRVGSNVSPAMPVAQVSRINELEVVVKVPERFISKVRTGLNAVIRLDAFPAERFPATVTELNPVVDPLSRTLEVKLRFTRPDRRVRAGMFAEVRIITEQRNDIVKLPAETLIRRFGETFVFVVGSDGRAQRRVVNPGLEIDNKVEITVGLSGGELVVYQGQSLLEDGAAVRIIETIELLTVEDTVR